MIPIPERVIQRVMSRWLADGDCWISTYSSGSHGYAQVGWNEDRRARVTVAHRVAWYSVHGEIPDEMTIDHMCFTRKCINPAHLRLLSRSENSGIHEGPWLPRNYEPPRKAPSIGRLCGRGHELVADKNGKPFCRDCNNAARHRRRLAAKA